MSRILAVCPRFRKDISMARAKKPLEQETSTDGPEQNATARAAKRPPAPEGDEVGAAEVGRRVAANIRSLRKTRGLSLDALSQASGVSRAALSQIETEKSNPSIGVLWKVATGLGIRFTELIDEPSGGVQVLRREDMQVLRSVDGRFESRPLAPAGASALVEVYELRLLGRARHVSEPHTQGTREILVVLSGRLRVSLPEGEFDLGAGDSVVFPSDVPHVYENTGAGETRCHNVMIYGR